MSPQVKFGVKVSLWGRELLLDDGALFPFRETRLNAVDGGGGFQLCLLAGGHVLAGHHAGADLVLPQKDHIGDAQLVGIGDFLLEFLFLAVELGAEQKAALEKRLLETTGYVQFEMHYDVDTSLLGGMVIRIGDRVVDSSIKTRLYELKKELSALQLA